MTMVKNSYSDNIAINAALEIMDNDILQALAMDCFDNEQSFFDAYCTKHKTKYGDDFVLDTPHPQY